MKSPIPDNVSQWLNGINPFTGRNIKTNGKIWRKLMADNDWGKYNPISAIHKSPIKWIGGKGALIPQIFERFPTHITRYIEPFCGGGSIFIEVLNRIDAGKISISDDCKFIVSDTNAILIDMFRRIQDDGRSLVAEIKSGLDDFENTKEEYIKRRARFNASPNVVDFIILNRQCFRGMWRVNKSGMMNVPYGNYKNPTIDYDGIIGLSDLFTKYGVKFYCAPYTDVLDQYVTGSKGQFIYLDPPFYGTFTSYTKDKFDYSEYISKLCVLYETPELYVVSSNSINFKDLVNFSAFTEYLFRKERMNSKRPGSIAREMLFTSINNISARRILDTCTDLTFNNPALMDWISFGPLFRYIRKYRKQFNVAESKWGRKLIRGNKKIIWYDVLGKKLVELAIGHNPNFISGDKNIDGLDVTDDVLYEVKASNYTGSAKEFSVPYSDNPLTIVMCGYQEYEFNTYTKTFTDLRKRRNIIGLTDLIKLP